MSISQLAPPALVATLASAQDAVGTAAGMGVAGVSNSDLGLAITALSELESQAAALRLALAAEADGRDVARDTADTGTDAWLARLTGDTREVNAGGIRLARLLQEKYDATREAFAGGRLRIAQVRVIVNAAEQSPSEATTDQVRAAEEWLVGKATGDGNRRGRPMDARRLRQAARRMFARIDADLAARHESILLGREHRHAEQETFLALHDNGNGTFSGRFLLPELHGKMLRRALDRLTSPRRLTRDPLGQPIVDESAPGTDYGRHTYEAEGAALCELIEHLPTEGHAANGVELLITLDLDDLLADLRESGAHDGSARLETGDLITAATARRLACEAGLIPAVLGGASEPLDLGRLRRLHSRPQRRALSLLYDSCAITGCSRPFAWCEIHHPQPWSRGGRTHLSNALPLCGHHHRIAHDPGWDLRHHGDGDRRFHRRR